MRTGFNFFHPRKVISAIIHYSDHIFYPTIFLLYCNCNSMSALWLIALFFIPEFTIQYLLSIYPMGCEKGLFWWIFWCVPHKCNIFFQTLFHDFLLNHIPISSIQMSILKQDFVLCTNANSKPRDLGIFNKRIQMTTVQLKSNVRF